MTKLLGSTKHEITKNKNVKNVPHLEITGIVFVQCIIANNNYQHNSRALYTFFHNKLFVQFLDILPRSYMCLKTFKSEFSYIEL